MRHLWCYRFLHSKSALSLVGIHRWRCSFWGFLQDWFWINIFLICHKRSYGLSLSPPVLQIFTPKCEDMPETQRPCELPLASGWHPRPGEQNPAPSFVLPLGSREFQRSSLCSPDTPFPLSWFRARAWHQLLSLKTGARQAPTLCWSRTMNRLCQGLRAGSLWPTRPA